MRVHDRASFLRAQQRVRNLANTRVKISNELRDFQRALHSIDHAIDSTKERMDCYKKGIH